MEILKNIWAGTKSLWDRFEAWVAGWVPGLKTYIVNGLAFLGSSAYIASEYMKSVDLSAYVNANTLAIAMIATATLTFWLKDIGNRVEEREEG
jgi:hypothetical protein